MVIDEGEEGLLNCQVAPSLFLIKNKLWKTQTYIVYRKCILIDFII